MFGLKSFHGFVILVGRIEPIARLAFYLVKKWDKILTKTISKKENSKIIQKTSKCSNRNTQKEANNIIS